MFNSCEIESIPRVMVGIEAILEAQVYRCNWSVRYPIISKLTSTIQQNYGMVVLCCSSHQTIDNWILLCVGTLWYNIYHCACRSMFWHCARHCALRKKLAAMAPPMQPNTWCWQCYIPNVPHCLLYLCGMSNVLPYAVAEIEMSLWISKTLFWENLLYNESILHWLFWRPLDWSDFLCVP